MPRRGQFSRAVDTVSPNSTRELSIADGTTLMSSSATTALTVAHAPGDHPEIQTEYPEGRPVSITKLTIDHCGACKTRSS